MLALSVPDGGLGIPIPTAFAARCDSSTAFRGFCSFKCRGGTPSPEKHSHTEQPSVEDSVKLNVKTFGGAIGNVHTLM